jgi:lysophospholipase L1-like esterase
LQLTRSFVNFLLEQRIYNWVLILAGTNDLLMSDSPSDKIADQIVIMHEVAHARGAKSIVITIPEIFCERTNCKNVKQRRQVINKRLRTYAAAAGTKAYLSDLALKLSLHQLSLEDRKLYWEPSGVHLKLKGYDKMAEIIFKDLMESMEAPIL